jgi:hypothetical protein
MERNSILLKVSRTRFPHSNSLKYVQVRAEGSQQYTDTVLWYV